MNLEETKKKIFIIENQCFQFEDIIDNLDNIGYDYYPERESFQKTIDLIRIYLNRRYRAEKRETAFKRVIEEIENFSPDLFIIDYVLVGNHSAKTGIDLACRFRKEKITQPILFFSRRNINEFKICKELPNVTGIKSWVNKGYSSKRILESDFFENVVQKEIEALLLLDSLHVSNDIIDDYIDYFYLVQEEKTETNAADNNAARAKSIKLLDDCISQLIRIKENKRILSDIEKSSLKEIKELTRKNFFEEQSWQEKASNLLSIIE